MRKLLTFAVVGGSLLASSAFAVAPVTPPPAAQKSSNDLLTAQEIRKLVDAGQFRDAVAALRRVIDLKPEAATDYDMHEMLMLQAECLLQIREPKKAVDALTTAIKSATKDNNQEHLDQANAFMELILKSTNNKYTPRTAPIKKPIDILNHESRKDAYKALFDDEFSDFRRLVKSAMLSPALAPILDAAKSAVALRAVEKIAMGNNKQSEDTVKELTAHAVKLINTGLDDLAQQTNRIKEDANRIITQTYQEQDGLGHTYERQQNHRQGLSAVNADALRNIIETCKKIPPITEEMAKWLGQQQDAFHVASLRAKNIQHDADIVLHDDYRTTVQ